MVKKMCNGARVSLRLMQITRWRTVLSLAIVVTGLSSYAMALPAFLGAEGYGAETIGGRGGTVLIVTNTNDSGPGSFRDAMLKTFPRIIIFRVSGTIVLNSTIKIGTAHNFVSVFGQTAPGDGIALQANTTGRLLELGGYQDRAPGAFHDGIFQHLRFRHGSATSNQDAMAIWHDSYNIIFDHNSFTWTGDELYNLWGDNIHDITMSHNIGGEGIVSCDTGVEQNLGPLHGGGEPQYRITYHHNLIIHSCYRNVRIVSGADGVTGVEFVNEVRYNNSTHMMNFNQTAITGPNDMQVDIVNSYFKRGSDGNPWPVRHGITQAGSTGDLDIHFEGSTWRNQDGTAHANNDEADNYNMMLLNGSPWTTIERATRITPQPTFPVSPTSAAQAYIDVVINENVGATKPRLDAVDQRLVDDPEDGGRWSAANVPPPHGTATRQTYNTFDVPTDTDSDGVPDSYETSLFGTDPNKFESQAVLDHDGDGFTNIEEYIYTLSEPGSPVPAESKPNPPTIVTAN